MSLNIDSCGACTDATWLKSRLLLDAGCAVSSKAIQVTEVGGRLVCRVMLSSKRLLVRDRGSLSGNKVSLPAGKQPNLLFFKGLRSNRKTSNETGQSSLSAQSAAQNSMTKSYVDGECKFFSCETGGKLANER